MNCINELEDVKLSDLDYYIESLKGLRQCPIDVERLKAIYAIFGISDEELETFLEFVETSEFGWQDDTYLFSNRCLRRSPGNNCKNNEYRRCFSWSNCQEQIGALSMLMFADGNDHAGSISILVIAYCISSIFASVLNRNRQRPPMYLQIACQKDSTTYELIQELVDICDVNSGIDGGCSYSISGRIKRCSHSMHKYYPGSLKYDLNELAKEYRDSPVIVSGFENQRNYRVLMREIANMAGKVRSFRPGFNVVPLFVSDVPYYEFDNILCLDLLNVTVNPKYLDIIMEYKDMFSSLVYAIICNYRDILFLDANMNFPKDYFPLSKNIDEFEKKLKKSFQVFL